MKSGRSSDWIRASPDEKRDRAVLRELVGGKPRGAHGEGQYRSFRAVHPFDERFGVETSGLMYELPSGHQHDLHNNGYFAVAPSVFHGIMRAMLNGCIWIFSTSASLTLGRERPRPVLA